MRADRALAGAAAAAIALGALACSDSTGNSAPPGPLPAFVYVADTNGYASLVRFRNDSSVALTAGSNNYDPNSAASRIVFTSERDGYPQIYIADVDVTTPHRVVHSFAFDYTPALSPLGDSIAYVSTRSGVPKVWLIRAPALNQATMDSAQMLATGSPAYTPESAPAWDPKGHKIAYTSVVTGTSQVYVIASGGGTPTRITNEGGGAFSPTWSADGSQLYYIAATPRLLLRRVDANGSNPMTIIPDTLTASGPASCNASYCLFAPAQNDTISSSMNALVLQGDSIKVLFARTVAKEREPAILVP
jgi:Tol biopolymer transport system component